MRRCAVSGGGTAGLGAQGGQSGQDLFYRLNVVSIWLPPLRARRDDIPSLVRSYAASLAEHGKRPHVCLPSVRTKTIAPPRSPLTSRGSQSSANVSMLSWYSPFPSEKGSGSLSVGSPHELVVLGDGRFFDFVDERNDVVLREIRTDRRGSTVSLGSRRERIERRATYERGTKELEHLVAREPPNGLHLAVDREGEPDDAALRRNTGEKPVHLVGETSPVFLDRVVVERREQSARGTSRTSASPFASALSRLVIGPTST